MRALIFQMIRFSLTGTLATLIHFSTVIALVETTHLQPLTANIFGFFSGFIISFSGHRFWTFSETTQRIRTSLPKFIFIAGINLVGNQSLYYLLLKKLHFQYETALIIVLGLMALMTFLLSKWWAFR